MYSVQINEDSVTDALARLEAHLGDMSLAMNEIGEQQLTGIEERFQQGVDPDGNPWAPKSATTIAAYEARGQRVDRRPLFGPNASGVPLRQSFFHQYGPDYVEVGSNAIQAAVMQFGAKKGAFGQTKKAGATGKTSPIPWGDIPARPMVGLSERDEANILETVAEWLDVDEA
ncbi:phage virion morphogenesis protein [Thalassococcus sp. S3]|uniref:phage virion morphogenesis protein n=1 Tax=Thalassococcus sp. S3 TaxID=2017482 RepID=UPI0010246221|nr:phage virion morphogenesis protein [Thalassococcus sp. S3]QBF31503.1 hypothetical protein CFI11_09780 [Thalassococcus sp. S3]